MLARLRAIAGSLKRDVLALWFVARDARTPLLVRLGLAFVAAYALSPIDLIPDFVPVLGYVDELILLPALVWLMLRFVPPDVLADGRRKAAVLAAKPRSWAGAAIILGVWVLLGWLAWRWWSGR